MPLPKSFNRSATPASRPLQASAATELDNLLRSALIAKDGLLGAHCIHEQWMRGAMATNIDSALESLWQHAADSIPEWLPMRHISWLSTAYEVAARFHDIPTGRSNIYLILLDYSDSRNEPYGVYVGMSRYAPAERFDQHKAGIRAAGSVTRRGLEALTGPTLHLQHIKCSEAARIEEQLAEALTAAGLFVKGGH
ncbi:MAG: hypothetical protein QM808_10740 [Steroidobacteraceae bacterium]